MHLRRVLTHPNSQLPSSLNWRLSRAVCSSSFFSFSFSGTRRDCSTAAATATSTATARRAYSGSAALATLIGCSSSFAHSQIFPREFHSSSCACAFHGRHSTVSGTSGIWTAGSDSQGNGHGGEAQHSSVSAYDSADFLQHVPGKFQYLDVHVPTPPPLPTAPYIDNQLARLSAAEQQRHLLKRAIEERHRLQFAENQRRVAEDVYNDEKHWLGGESEPRFNLWELAGDCLRILVVGSLASFTIYFFLLPFGKLFGVPVPNPAMALFQRLSSFVNDWWQRFVDDFIAEAAGQLVPQYEKLWLDALADKVVFKMKNPGAPLPPQDKLFIFPAVVQLRENQLQSTQQIEEAIRKVTQAESSHHH